MLNINDPPTDKMIEKLIDKPSVFIFLLMMKQKVVDLPKVTDVFVLIAEKVADEEY